MRLRFTGEDIRELLGYQQPKDLKIAGEDIAISGVKGFDYITAYTDKIWEWIKDNRVLVALIGLGVLLGLLWAKKG